MTERDEPISSSAGTSGGEVLGGSAGEELGADLPEPRVAHSREYLRSLLLLLLAATFFEGYDGAILSLVLVDIRDTFNVAESQLGVSRAIIELGLGAAFFLARAGDRWGRRKLLLFSVLGYTLMTAATAFSWDLWSFTAFQSLSRVFLGAEYAVALTMIVEEFPKERRARAIGTLLMCSAIGAVVVALLLVVGVADGPRGWRTLYLIGVIPLVFLAFFRRRIKETRRFEEHAESVRTGGGSLRLGFFEPWRPQFRRTLVLVGSIHLLRSLPLFGATSWFFYFAEREAGMNETSLYVTFIVAYGFGTLGYLVCGRLMDRIGRRPTAIAYGVLAAASASALFQVRGTLALAALLVVAVFFGLGMAPVLGAISTELFPTYIRNQSAAWARNIFEIAGFILGPLLVGVLGDHYTGLLGSVGDTVSILTLLFIPATYLTWRHLPETRGRELEEIEDDLGIAHVQHEERAGRPSAWRPVAFAAVAAGLVVIATMGVGILGGITRRPEGAAERFLQAVDTGKRDEIAKYGSIGVAASLFGSEPVDFQRIVVSRSIRIASLEYVPFTAELDDGRAVSASLLVSPERDGSPPELKVVALSPNQAIDPEEPEGAPMSAWAAGIVAVLMLTLGAELALRALRTTA